MIVLYEEWAHYHNIICLDYFITVLSLCRRAGGDRSVKTVFRIRARECRGWRRPRASQLDGSIPAEDQHHQRLSRRHSARERVLAERGMYMHVCTCNVLYVVT